MPHAHGPGDLTLGAPRLLEPAEGLARIPQPERALLRWPIRRRDSVELPVLRPGSRGGLSPSKVSPSAAKASPRMARAFGPTPWTARRSRQDREATRRRLVRSWRIARARRSCRSRREVADRADIGLGSHGPSSPKHGSVEPAGVRPRPLQPGRESPPPQTRCALGSSPSRAQPSLSLEALRTVSSRVRPPPVAQREPFAQRASRAWPQRPPSQAPRQPARQSTQCPPLKVPLRRK